ncbi:MAG TPA: hypothetical protein VKR06_42525 [Ktedonosporobacter sp.]|nr:hypothetical protein [Ktedonosporobacter sp.]
MPEQRGRGPDSWIINLSTELFPILDRFKERFIFGFLQRQPLYTRQANVSSSIATPYQQAYPASMGLIHVSQVRSTFYPSDKMMDRSHA